MGKLDVKQIADTSNIFIAALFKMASSDSDDNNFLNLVLGLIYSSKKILRAIEAMSMIDEKQLDEIEKQLSAAAKNDIVSTIEMYKNKIKEKKDVGSDKCE